ncbi:MAG: CotH kinase family protein [Candidatus Azobacteroides sp.]|nr:CotH kinase family protein [Candidatus Azobacteroides sp.]
MDGSEPTPNSKKYTNKDGILLTETTCVRAIAFSENKLPSEITSATYFINEREFDLPVVSIITDEKNLFDDMIGIYTKGINGIEGNCETEPVNWNQSWNRPVNFELFDTEGISCLNQELDISISGGCSRKNPLKSLKISPRKKFGDNRLRYDIFSEVKPNKKYKDILFRNSGNDFYYSMMRDGFMQSLIIDQMNIDYQAYKPAICFINGEYYGIQNLRERTNKDYLYTNYGLDEEEFYLLKTEEIITHPEFIELTNFVKNNDITNHEIYQQVKEKIDIDSYIHYMIAEIYYENRDWPHNNFKVWKKKQNGKWRWLLYDTDYGYNLFDNGVGQHNTLRYVLEEAEEWSILIFRRLILNNEFKERFIHQFCIHLSSTFEIKRVGHIMDSISSKISQEIIFHKNKCGSEREWNYDLALMKEFSQKRPNKMLTFISDYFFNSASIKNISLKSNIKNPSLFFFSENILHNDISIKYFNNEKVILKAAPVRGYTFKHWEFSFAADNKKEIITDAELQINLSTHISLNAIYKEDQPAIPMDKPDIYINEVVSRNNMFKDEYGDTNDYIELYNDELFDVDIAGWYISDTPSRPTLYQFPDNYPEKTVIPAKGRIILWADKQPYKGPLHLNFSLSKAGETLILSRKNEENKIEEIDKVTFPALEKNMSYSRIPDGSEKWVIQAPTFNAPNSNDSEFSEKKNNFKIYPTTVKDYFIIENAEYKNIRIFDFTGKTVLNHFCTTDVEYVPVSTCSKGIFFVMIEDETFKIIKK